MLKQLGDVMIFEVCGQPYTNILNNFPFVQHNYEKLYKLMGVGKFWLLERDYEPRLANRFVQHASELLSMRSYANNYVIYVFKNTTSVFFSV